MVVIAFADTAELAVRLTLDDKFSRQIGRAQGALGKFNGSVGRVGKGVGQLGAGLVKASAVGLAAVGTGLTFVAKAAIDFEDAFAGVVKTVNASPAELAVLRNELLDLSTTIPISAVELANLAETAGALGIQTSGIDEFVKTAALLGVTTNVSAQEAATSLGILANVLHVLPEDFDNLGSALVNLGNQGASTEAQILDIAQRFGAAGKRFGLATDEILALAEATASFSGLKVEAAGSSLVRLLGTLTVVAGEGGEKLDLLNKIAGTDFKRAMGEDASGALEAFLKGFAKLDKFEAARALKELGLSGVFLNQLLGGLSQNTDGLAKSFDNAHAAFFDFNALQIEADKRFATTASRFAVLRGNILRAAITMGDGFVPALGRAAEKLTAFLRLPATQGELAKLGQDIGRFIDGINWTEVITGAREFVGLLKNAGTVAIGIVQALNALPKEVKALGLGLIGLNKISGGLVGAGIGNIVGGLGEVLAKSLAARIPLFGSAFVQPVFVTNMGVGGLGGVPGTAGKAGAGAARTAFNVILPLAVALAIGEAINEATGGPTGGRGREIAPGIIIGQSQRDAALGTKVIQGTISAASAAEQEKLAAINATLTREGAEIAALRERTAERLTRVGMTFAEQQAATRAVQGAQTAALRERLAERLNWVAQAQRTGSATVAARVTGTNMALGLVGARIAGLALTTAGVRSAALATAGAVRGVTAAVNRKRLSVSVTNNTVVSTYVSARDIQNRTRTTSRYGYAVPT